MNEELSSNKLRAQVRAFTRGGQVVRFHTLPQLHPQLIAAHSYGVAWLCWVLTQGAASAELLYAALVHDVPEFLTGDLPHPTKKHVGLGVMHELEQGVMATAHLPEPRLSGEEKRVLELADLLEGMLQCARERSLGNQLLGSVFARYREAARALLRHPTEEFVWGFINQKYHIYQEGT